MSWRSRALLALAVLVTLAALTLWGVASFTTVHVVPADGSHNHAASAVFLALVTVAGSWLLVLWSNDRD